MIFTRRKVIVSYRLVVFVIKYWGTLVIVSLPVHRPILGLRVRGSQFPMAIDAHDHRIQTELKIHGLGNSSVVC